MVRTPITSSIGERKRYIYLQFYLVKEHDMKKTLEMKERIDIGQKCA